MLSLLDPATRVRIAIIGAADRASKELEIGIADYLEIVWKQLCVLTVEAGPAVRMTSHLSLL